MMVWRLHCDMAWNSHDWTGSRMWLAAGRKKIGSFSRLSDFSIILGNLLLSELKFTKLDNWPVHAHVSGSLTTLALGFGSCR